MAEALFESLEQRDLARLSLLLETGVNANEGDARSPNWVPLMSAVEELSEGGPIEAVVLLLQHGAAVNPPEAVPETTPLLVAVLNKQLEAARILLASGADPNVMTAEGESPLRLSVSQADREMATLLLWCGAKKSINDSGGPSGMNALGMAAWMLNLPMIDLLLNAGANPDHLDADHQPAYRRLPPRESADQQLWDTVLAKLKL